MRTVFIKTVSMAILWGLLGVVGCARFHYSTPDNSHEQEAEAIKALFEHLFGETLPSYVVGGHTNHTKVVFLACGASNWDGRIPPMPDDFAPMPSVWFSILARSHIPVRNVTDIAYTPKMGFVSERSTGDPGVIFSVDKLLWISGDEVHIDAQRYSGFMNAVGARYLLHREQGTWRVVGSMREWIQ